MSEISINHDINPSQVTLYVTAVLQQFLFTEYMFFHFRMYFTTQQSTFSRFSVWAESVRHPWGKLPANKASSYRSSSSNRTRSYRKLDHNLVLLKMKKPFTLTKYVQPACLPDRKLKLKTGTRCATTGWGWASVTSLLMQQVATVLPWSQCAEVKVRLSRQFGVSFKSSCCCWLTDCSDFNVP